MRAHDHRPMLQRALIGNTGAHSAVEMALLDLAGRAGETRLIDLVAPARCARASRRCGCSAMPRPNRTSPKRRRSGREGFNFFKLKIGVKPLARRDRGRARDPRGASRRHAVRRRQLRPDARGGAPLRGTHARRGLDVHRAAAAGRRPRRSEGARARHENADRHGRKHPVARRHRGGASAPARRAYRSS